MKPSSLILDNPAVNITKYPTYWALFFLNTASPHYNPSSVLYTPIFNKKIHTNKKLTNTHTNIFYLKKFKIYTKLKYSRTPGVDTAASAIAAFLAGLIGFILTEKAGFELLDSGDLFYGFMYIILLVLIAHPYLKLLQLEYDYDLNLINI